MAQLKHFLLVVDHGGFRVAATEAFRSQPALSRSIRELEQRIGGRLFEAGRAELTMFGAGCVPYARELAEHFDRAVSAMQRLADREEGVLTIASVPTVATQWLPDLVRRYIERHPKIEIRILDDNSRNIQAMVLAGEVDFGICSRVGVESRLQFQSLVKDSFGLVCRADHALAGRRSIGWNELASLPIIGTVAHQQIEGVPEMELLAGSHLFVSNMLSLIAMLEQGLGVTVLPSLGVPASARGLVFVPLKRPKVHRELGILSLNRRSLSPAAATMAKMLMEHAAAAAPT
ncbi:LysR substrate-binding domain-containing protein [Cupriavidus sp. H39]|uniref:LysR family transcriptional regulator n=1 Tax=Cupriavidus sp. H39 TaxID=3401635 RepID=UPI003D020B91